jgi:hypothetical protein
MQSRRASLAVVRVAASRVVCVLGPHGNGVVFGDVLLVVFFFFFFFLVLHGCTGRRVLFLCFLSLARIGRHVDDVYGPATMAKATPLLAEFLGGGGVKISGNEYVDDWESVLSTMRRLARPPRLGIKKRKGVGNENMLSCRWINSKTFHQSSTTLTMVMGFLFFAKAYFPAASPEHLWFCAGVRAGRSRDV